MVKRTKERRPTKKPKKSSSAKEKPNRSIEKILQFGPQSDDEDKSLRQYRRAIREFARSVEPSLEPTAANRYLSEAAAEAKVSPARLWYCLQNRGAAGTERELDRVRCIMLEFVSGQRQVKPVAQHLAGRASLGPREPLRSDARPGRPYVRVWTGNTRKHGSHLGPH
jgi:hypothetical protein